MIPIVIGTAKYLYGSVLRIVGSKKFFIPYNKKVWALALKKWSAFDI
jgi:hypothetical protein